MNPIDSALLKRYREMKVRRKRWPAIVACGSSFTLMKIALLTHLARNHELMYAIVVGMAVAGVDIILSRKWDHMTMLTACVGALIAYSTGYLG